MGVPAVVRVDAHHVHEVEADIVQMTVGGIGDGPGRVRLPGGVDQALHHQPPLGGVGGALVEHAPRPDAGMVAVALDHRPHHGRGAIGDDVLHHLLAAEPPQRDLFHEQDAALVAQIEQALVVGIVGTADARSAEIGQQLQVSEHQVRRQGEPPVGVVLVAVHPANAERLAVQQDVGAPHDEAAKAGAIDDVIPRELEAHRIELRVAGRPQPGVGDVHRKEEHLRIAGVEAHLAALGRPAVEVEGPALVDHAVTYVGQFRPHAQRRFGSRYHRRQSHAADVSRPRQLLHPHGPVNAAVAEPIEVRRGDGAGHVMRVVHPHHQFMLTRLERRNGEAKGKESAVMLAQRLAVEPDVGLVGDGRKTHHRRGAWPAGEASAVPRRALIMQVLATRVPHARHPDLLSARRKAPVPLLSDTGVVRIGQPVPATL